MTQGEETAGLRDDVRRLRAALEGLAATLNAQVVERVDAKVVEQVRRVAVPRDELRKRWWKAAAVFAAVVLLLLASGWVTERHTLADEHRVVTECFLSSGRLTPQQAAVCARTFPRYGDLQRQNAANSARFQQLLAQVPELERRVRRLEQERRR